MREKKREKNRLWPAKKKPLFGEKGSPARGKGTPERFLLSIPKEASHNGGKKPGCPVGEGRYSLGKKKRNVTGHKKEKGGLSRGGPDSPPPIKGEGRQKGKG